MNKKKTVEERLEELEDFHYRVKLGQKWFLCGVAALGSGVAFVSYLLSSINSWLNLFNTK